MYDDVIWLISEDKQTDELGDQIVSRQERMVFADLRSVGQSEFYQAQAVGLKPEIKFVLADYLDYKNEKMLKYRGFGDEIEEEYTVIRTFRNCNSLELVCKRGID